MANLLPQIFDVITQPLAAVNYNYARPVYRILTSAGSTPDIGWAGYSVRQRVPLAHLTNPGFNPGYIRVTFTTAPSSVSANLNAAWIGPGIVSPAYDFDGSQVQLTFNEGSATQNGMTGAVTFTSDFVPLTFNFSTAVSLIISTHWSGTNVDSFDTTSTGSTAFYLLQATGTEGSTAPSGVWLTDITNVITFNQTVDFASAANGAFVAGDTLTEYNVTSAVLGVGTVLSVSNTAGASGTLLVAPLSGNLQSNVVFFNQSNSVVANVTLYTDQTATGSLLQVPTTMTLTYAEANGFFNVGDSVYELDAGGIEIVSGVVSAATLQTITLVNCSTVFWTNTMVVDRVSGTAANVRSISLSVGLYTNSSYSSLPGNWCFDPNFFTSANVSAVSTGFGASFQIGTLNNTELVSLNTDLLLTYQAIVLNVADYGAAIHHANHHSNAIFSQAITLNDPGWTGFNLRQILPTADLTASPGTSPLVRVTIGFFSTAFAANIDEVWIGEQNASLQPYNFDGNQKQLTFVGSPTINNINGTTVIATDDVIFNYTGTSTNLVVSFHFSGTTVSGQRKSGAGTPETQYSISGTSQAGVTAPTGVWTTTANTLSFVAKVEVVADTTLLAALNYSSVTLGSIASLKSVNPGLNYSFAPIVFIYEPLTIDYYETDLIFYISQPTGIFQVGETISQSNVGAVGIVKSASANSVSVRRIQFETFWLANNHIHDSTYLLVGAKSGATANLDNFIADTSAPTIGENAMIATNTETANGLVTGLEVISSGFCFNQGDVATFSSADGLRAGSAFAVLNNQGVSPGYYRDRKGWLSSDQRLLDSYYWQQYSYDVKSAVSPNIYESMLRSLLHVAGKIHFSSIVRQSAMVGSANVSASFLLTVNQLGPIDLNFTKTFRSGWLPVV